MKIHPNSTILSYDRHIAACDWGVLFTALYRIVPNCTALYRIQTIAYANAIKSPKRGSREKRSPPLFLDDLYLSLWQFLCSAGAIRSSGCVDLHQCDNPKKKLYRINIDLSEVFDSS